MPSRHKIPVTYMVFDVLEVDGRSLLGSPLSARRRAGREGTVEHLADVSIDAMGNIYVPDRDNQRIRKIDSGGIISTIAGTGEPGFSGDGGPARSARLDSPLDVVLDSLGNVYVADTRNHRVRKIDSRGIISTVAGSQAGFSGDRGPAASASLLSPAGLAFDSAGNLYIADTGNNRIRKLTPKR